VFYCHDANKNVTDLVDTIGDVVAHYEYSPFGVITDQSEELASLNPFRFSNEYFDSNTVIVEYKLRPYFPSLGKFMSRDPIGVQGGLNEYGICANDLINGVDWWGLSAAYYATVLDETLFHLAAEEKHVHKNYSKKTTINHKEYDDQDAKRALLEKTQTSDWGSLFVSSVDVKAFSGNNILDARSIVNEAGSVYIFSHGSNKGNIFTSGFNSPITPDNIQNAYNLAGEKTNLKSIWALSCHFGSSGGAQEWSNILGIPVTGHINTGNPSIVPILKLNYWRSKWHYARYDNAFETDFSRLTDLVSENSITYDEFYKRWEQTFKKWEEKGCVKQAYWHVYDTTYNYKTYPPKGEKNNEKKVPYYI
nr:RHS repeat-associated core domain-containing protein [Kiritimatiellia bacterium]